MTTKPMMEELHESRLGRSAFQVIVIALALTEGVLAMLVAEGRFWLAVPVVLVASHLMHGILVGFHEASHGLLRRNRRFNEFDGMLIGILSFTSFSLYRAAHQTHHAFLASERDEELWPFVHPDKPRWTRVLAAILELTLGLLFTPFLFIRTFFRSGSPIRNKKVRRRIWAEFALIAIVWTVILVTVAIFNLWKYLLWLYLIPGVLAADMQSWRKYIEHVGLLGSTDRGSTRSIISDGWAGKFLSFTLLHEPYHGVHHLHAGLPHEVLPQLAAELEPQLPEEKAPFKSYWSATCDLLRQLADPRVGAQWERVPSPVSNADGTSRLPG